MPDYERYDGNGNVIEQRTETLAEADAIKEMQVDALDIVALRTLFNHENRMRALVRGVRAIATATQRTTLDDQGVEAARANLTAEQFRAAIKSLL